MKENKNIAVQPTEKAESKELLHTETLTNDTFFDLATFSDVPIVNEYFKDIKSMYHDGEITIAIEKFALWLENKNSPKNL